MQTLYFLHDLNYAVWIVSPQIAQFYICLYSSGIKFHVIWKRATNVCTRPVVYLQRTKLSQKSVPMYQNIRRHIQKDCTFIPFSRGNLTCVSTVGDWIICCVINCSGHINEVNHTDTSTESFEVPLTCFIYAGMNWPWTGWQRLLHHPILALV